jgi:signal peptidase II
VQVGRRIAVEARRPALLFGLVFLVALLLDQATKWIVRASLEPAETIPVVEDIFHLTFVRNTGAAFGLMPGRQSLFVLNSAVVLLAVAIYLMWQRPRSRWLLTALALVSGGAMGNLVDRLVSGRVTDFFDFRVLPVFNVADSCIFVGAAMLILWILLGPEGKAEEEVGAPNG